MRRLISWAVAMLLIAGAHAQTFRGAINGVVTDPSGALVPSAQVEAVEKLTGIGHKTLATADGQFALQDLPLGKYKVFVRASGFSDSATDNVDVVAGTIYTLPVRLSLAQSSTTIEVSAATLAVDTTTATETVTFPGDVIQNLPLNGRDFTQLIAMGPGYGGYSVGGFGSLNGTRANQMNWQIDGVDNNDLWHNFPAVNQGGVSGIAGVILPIDSIDEFSSQTQSGAETGRSAAGTINLVTKSGGNSIHGSAYYYNRNEVFAAASPFFTPSTSNPAPPPLRNSNWGGTVGGPIFRNKTFYFAGFEKQNYKIALSGLATEPSDAWINQALALMQTYGIAESSLSANLIGPNGFWPRNEIASLPGTSQNFFSPVASTGYSFNGVIKLDHNFSDKHHLSLRWFGGQGSQTAPLGGAASVGSASSNLSDYFEVAPIHVYNYSVVVDSGFTPHLINQLLVGVNYFNQVFHDRNNSFDSKAMGLYLSPDAAINGKPILGAPNIAISGFEPIGLTPPEGRNDVTGHLADTVSYSTGRHQFRFGGEVRQARVNEFYHRTGTGQFVFDGSQGPWKCPDDPTCALADFLAGRVSTSSIAVGNPERFVTINGFSLYANDAWQMNSRLNLNFGLRYEYFGPLHSDRQDLAVFVPGQGLLIQGNGIGSIYPPDKKDFAPRFGFAYQPTAKGDLVLRGGFGVFYDQININPFLDFRPPIGSTQGLQGNPIGPKVVSNYTRSAYNWQTVQSGGNSIFPGVVTCANPSCAGTPGFDVFGISQTFRTPYFYNFNLQIEKSLGKAALFQVGYVGSQGRRLSLVSNINQNNAFPNFNAVLEMNSSGTSNYNSLQSIFRLRSWHGITSQFNYTFSHGLDEISEYRSIILDDAFNPKFDYGNSDFDTRHLFSANFTFDVPGSSHGPKLLTHGWQVSSLWNFHTGQPSDAARLGLDLIGNPYAGVDHTFSAANGGTQWWNPAAFAEAAPGTIGNLSRNKFYGPGYGDVDLSVVKNIPIRERVKMQLRAEMFNVFNRVNLASGPGSIGRSCGAANPDSPSLSQRVCTSNSGFGLVSDTIGDFNGAPGIGPGEAFNMQFAIKITF